MKKCSQCGELKPLTEFYKDKRTKSGLYSGCKSCHNQNQSKGYNKEWREKNPDKVKAYRKKMKEYHKDYRRKNKEHLSQYYKQYIQNNTEKRKEYVREHVKERRKTDIKFRINANLSAEIRKALKNKKASRGWESLVGYTSEDLMKHLESQFESWMTWENYGKWHIDHIKPKSLFKYETAKDPEFKKCWALENLQPLEAIENIIKSNYFNQ